MRKAAALLMTAVILLLSVIPINAFTIVYDGKTEDYPWDPIVLVVDGNTVKTEEMPPVILNGRTMVPAREFFEQLGATVSWDNDSKRVIIEYNGEKIILKINSKTVYIGANSASISASDPAPKIINDKTMIPVRFVAEEFGFDVKWVNETRTVNITSPHKESVALTNVTFSSDDESDCIFVQLDEFVNPNVFKMQDPERIVIDVYGVKATMKDGSIACDGESVKSVRYSQHSDRFRIVADLKAESDFEVLKLKNGVEISIIKTGDVITDDKDDDDKNIPDDEEVNEDATVENPDGKLTVILDPGHGGTDPGATYPIGVKNPDYKEKDITLAVALQVRENLEKNGVKVIMTRDDDVYPTLKERVEMANASTADIYVSIHVNAMENKDGIDGGQVYYHKGSEFGKKLAEHVYNGMIKHTGLTKRGIQDGSSLYVIRNTKMPAILTEGGFITNKGDREYISSEKGIREMAAGISEGILEALDLL